MDLQTVRERIDRIDSRLVKLLNERACEVAHIGALKRRHKTSSYAAQRETAILKRLKQLNAGPMSQTDIDAIFREIMSVCRSLQEPLHVAYFGPEGTNTHLAAVKNFGKAVTYVSCERISDVFDAVERGEVSYGVVPIENSTEGVVNYTLDMFFTSSLQICAEVTLPIAHTLMATTRGPYTKIYSHPQVLAQCRSWLASHYPHTVLVPVSSTAKAAMMARAHARTACVGNAILSQIYGVRVIAGNIEDFASNMTRFLVVAKHDSGPSGCDKTSLLFAIKDKIGALYEVLRTFKSLGINLTKIESRPSRKKIWEYYFFVDIAGHRTSSVCQKALASLERHCVFVKLLGSYPKES